MSLGGITDYLKANNISMPEDYSSVPYLPYAQQGPYQAIMSQMGNYGGGAGTGYQQGAGNVYGGGGGSVMGGYNPDLYKRAPTPTDSYMYGGGPNAGGGPIASGRGGGGGERLAEKNDPTAWSNLSPAERASFYADNPGFGTATGLIQSGFGFTPLGQLQNFLVPDFVANQKLEAQGNRGLTVGDGGAPGMGGGTGLTPISTPINENTSFSMINGVATPVSGMEGNTGSGLKVNFGPIGGGGGGYTGGYQTSGEFKGMPSSFGGIGASAYAKGGPVSMNRLQGPNPAGPDDGYATLKSGEFVINDKAVKKYGIELMNAINSGKISKGKLRGLLEM